MDTKMTAIITGLIVIGAAAGIGTYVGMDRDGSEQTSDYAILDDLDANLRRGLTAEVIENNQNANEKVKVVKALTIDDVADGTYTLSERESSKGNGETSIAMALIMMYFASDSKVVFTSEQDNRYATTTVTTEGDVKVFHTVGKSASGFDCNVTVKESATTPFTYLYIDGWFFMETTETDEDGDRTSVDNHVLIEYKGDDRAWIDYSMDVVETSVMNKMEAKEEFTELIGSDAVEYPEKIITAGEKSKELFGNVECDRYTLTGELIDDDETYKSGTLYMYKNIPLKFSGKVMDSAGMESETSIELRIYIE